MSTSTVHPRGLSKSLFVAAAALVLPLLASADPISWTGASNASWATGGNWSPGAPTAADTVFFDANSTANLSTTLNVALSVAGITVTSPSGAVTIANGTGGSLAIGSGGIDLSAATQNLTFSFTANSLLSLSANQTWNVASGRELTFSGNGNNRTFDLGGSTITRTGDGTAYIGGGISLSNGTFDLQGGLTILRGDANQSTTANTVDFKVGSGATLRVTRTGSSPPGYNFSAPVEINGGTLELAGSQNHNIQGVISGTGGIISGTSGSTADKTFTNAFTGSGTFAFQNSLGGSSLIILSGDNSGFTGTVNVNGTAGSRRLQINAATAGSASATWNVAANNRLIVGAGGAGAQFGAVNTSGITSINGDATLGDATIATGGLIDGTGTLTVNDTLVVNGTLTATTALGANAAVSGTGAINTDLTLGDGSTLAPGDASIDTLNVGGNVILLAGAQLIIEINTDTATFDILNFTDSSKTLFFGTGAELLVINTGSAPLAESYQIITGGATLADLGLIISGNPGYGYSLGLDGVLHIAAIPEPGTYALLGRRCRRPRRPAPASAQVAIWLFK